MVQLLWTSLANKKVIWNSQSSFLSGVVRTKFSPLAVWRQLRWKWRLSGKMFLWYVHVLFSCNSIPKSCPSWIHNGSDLFLLKPMHYRRLRIFDKILQIKTTWKQLLLNGWKMWLGKKLTMGELLLLCKNIFKSETPDQCDISVFQYRFVLCNTKY